MKKYAKIHNAETNTVIVGNGDDKDFYASIGMTEMEVEEGYNGAWYLAGYAPQKPITEAQSVKIVELKNERNTREEAPVEYGGKLWDFDSKARDRITAAATALELGGVESIEWTAHDDSSSTLTAADLKGIIAAAALRGDALHKKYRELRDRVNSATTEEEVNAVVWED